MSQAEALLEKKDNIHERAGVLNLQLAQQGKNFNTNFKTGAALVLLASKAESEGVLIKNLEPLGIVNKEQYFELPMKLELRGQYHAILSFLSFCENLPNLSEIRQLEIKPELNQTAGSLYYTPEKTGEIETANYPQTIIVKCILVIFSDPRPNTLPETDGQAIDYHRTGREDPFVPPAGMDNNNSITFLNEPPNKNTTGAAAETNGGNGNSADVNIENETENY